MSPIVTVVLPIFAIIVIGYLVGRAGLLGATASDVLNKFVYWIALPPLLFLAMSRLDVGDILNWPFIGAFLGSTLAIWALIALVGGLAGRARPPVAILQGMNASFGNTGYMGIPLFVAAFGLEGLAPASLGTMLTSGICIGVAVVSLELTARAGRGALVALGDSLSALFRNPLVMASVAGIGWGWAGGALPAPMVTLLDLLGAAASPCALFAIGLFLAGRSLRADLAADFAEVGGVVAAKILLHPLLCWALAMTVFPMDPFWTASAVLLAALPTGSLTFVVAQKYGLYRQRSSSVIVVSTIGSLVTLSALFVLFDAGG